MKYLKLRPTKRKGFSGGSDTKESACNVGDPGLIPGSRSSHGEGNGNPLQYSCLEDSMDRWALRVTVYGVTKESDMTEQLPLAHSRERVLVVTSGFHFRCWRTKSLSKWPNINHPPQGLYSSSDHIYPGYIKMICSPPWWLDIIKQQKWNYCYTQHRLNKDWVTWKVVRHPSL